MLAGVDGITFDFYNTLVRHRTGQGRGASLMDYLEGHGLESDPWEHQVLYDVFEPHALEYPLGGSPREKQTYLERFAERVFRRLNVRAAVGAAAEHAAAVWKRLGPGAFAVFPEVQEVLRGLRARGLRLAVVSNWQCGLGYFCTELGLGGRFDHVLASAEVGAAKPDPAIFADACDRLGLPPKRALHVGDSPIDDVQGATEAGLQAILLRRGRADEPEAAPVTIGSLKELPPLLGPAS